MHPPTLERWEQRTVVSRPRRVYDLGIGTIDGYVRYLQQVHKRNELINEFEAVHRSTSDLLREEREEREAALAPPPPEDAVPQGERPNKKAQWDEKRACWVQWDEKANAWMRCR